MSVKNKARVNLFIDPEKLKEMKIEAIRRGISLSKLVEFAFEIKYKKDKKESTR